MKEKLAGALGPPVVAALYHTLAASYRYVVGRPERLDDLLVSGPVVLTLWHGQAFAAARFLDRRLHRGGLALTVIASQSRDGELVARLAASLGIPVARGSTSRGGRAAILALYRSLVKQRSSPLVAPDGPRGPRHAAKAGAVLLAQFAQVPIVPLAFAADRSWRLGSWDRMEIPRPGARVAVVVGQPQHVPRRLSSAELELARARMEASLDALALEARAVLGAQQAEGAAVGPVESTGERPGKSAGARPVESVGERPSDGPGSRRAEILHEKTPA
ncbi:MAG TPA: lysophospholipid acyltransferase family protein [Thermoanaerobaculia bacterium]|nr:lysophospholipid acyltransferase family protein [Thermoanaerobaculia bacterium]